VTSPHNQGAQPAPFYDKPTPSQDQTWTTPPVQADVFAHGDASPSMTSYPVLQPSQSMVDQPSTKGEDMVYPGAARVVPFPTQPESQDYRHQAHLSPPQVLSYQPQQPRDLGSGLRRCSTNGSLLPSDEARSHNLNVVSSHQRPPPAKRGPFKTDADREETAETRRHGSCLRCRKQRIRVSCSAHVSSLCRQQQQTWTNLPV
jgi:hypothetical protein